MGTKRQIIPTGRIVQAIHLLRGQKVMLDGDIVTLYQVPTGHLNRAIGFHVREKEPRYRTRNHR